jgi:hypothetical protein
LKRVTVLHNRLAFAVWIGMTALAVSVAFPAFVEAQAASPGKAEKELTFTLMSVTDEAVTIDLGSVGISQGDMIASHGTLYGAQFGEVRGRHDFVSVITDPLDQPDETVQVRLSQQTYTLSDGVLMAHGITLIAPNGADSRAHYAISGGTGAYANARGNVEFLGNGIYEFHLVLAP